MAYLNVDLDYFDHPKTARLVGLLGRGAEVLPLKLWCYCGKYHKRDGRLTGYSAHEIESVIGWWGKQGDLVNAMVKVGFLDTLEDSGGFQVHDWQETQGHLYAFEVRAKTAARAKWDQVACSKDATRILQASNKQCSILTDLPNQPKDTTSVSSLSLNDKAKEETPPSKAPKRPKKAPVAYWAELIDFIKKRWEYKKRDGVWEFSGKDAELLNVKARLYGVPKLMALYVIYLRTPDPWYVKHGYDIPTFCEALGWLIDQPGWKEAAAKYDTEFNAPKTTGERAAVAEVATVISSMMNGKVGTAVSDIRKGHEVAGRLNS